MKKMRNRKEEELKMKKKDKKITENHFSQLLILIHYNCAHKCIKALQWWDL